MTGIVVTEEMLKHLKRGNGRDISAVEVPDGYLVTANDPAVEHQVEIALKIMDKYAATLRILAK
ncbi:MAG TPA: AbrB/MazE/SpoVT family DNA-binding domain-containing protein [Candidatus Angelobacter sp.]|nr:AbrB/MazE/SpoVT family DNA-binding domain-containing protein [Candidatus Angelobacter sp.]